MDQSSEATVTTRTADVTAVPLLNAMLDQLRGELATLRVALDSERSIVRALKRDRSKELRAVREEETKKRRNALSDLKSRFERNLEDSLLRQKVSVTKTLNAEMLRALKVKDAEMRQELSDAHAREDELKRQVRDAQRANREVGPLQQSGATISEIQKLQQEVSSLRSHNKQMEERLQIVIESDRQKANDLRSQHEEHEQTLVQIKKTSQQETQRLLEELKSKERQISQLEKQLIVQKGRIEEQRDRLLDPHPRECQCSDVSCTRARERCLKQRIAELQSAMKKAAETHAHEKKEMIRKLHELEGKSPVCRHPKPSAPTVASNGKTVVVQDVDGNVPQPPDEELFQLRIEIEERDKIIFELKQAARERDRKLDHLSNRHRKEQMRQYHRQFMELEPVAELEEDSGAGEDSPSSSGSPSLSPQPFNGDMWTELSDQEYHDTLYSCLLKEHLELQREYQFLQARLRRDLAEPNRIRLRLEHELAAARTQVRELKRMFAEQKGGGVMMSEKIAALQAETHDLREQNELLEFRILELEECHENSSVRSRGPDTRDVWTDTESDSGVQSLPTSEETHSDSEFGIHAIKQEIQKEELMSRLLELAKSSSSTTERCCLQQVLALLESYETRIEKLQALQDQMSNTVKLDNTTTNSTVNSGGRSLKILPESTIGSLNDCSKVTSRIIATVLPFTDLTADTTKEKTDGIPEADTFTKQLKNAECLEESGIFEETEFNTQETQTERVEYTVGFKPVFEDGVLGDLSAEIQKLNQFRERVEERGNCCRHKTLLNVEEGGGDLGGDSLPTSCIAHTKELQYCRERLQILEDKVLVYESSGDLQTRLLSERLQKEVQLSAQVKQLSAKVEQLVALNKHLEEEKCEFEEAENDTRLKCQKLEMKIVALNEKKSDLQTQLQQERRNMSRLRTSLSESERKKQDAKGQLSYVETVLNKYENRNYELEEREVELRHRLEMLETTMPALMIWNMWRLVQDPKVSRAAVNSAVSNALVKASSGKSQGKIGQCGSLYINCSINLNPRITSVYSSKLMNSQICIGDEGMNLRELEADRNRILTERHQAEEKWRLTERKLKDRLQILESQAGPLSAELEKYKEAEDGFRERIQKLENELSGKKGVKEVSSLYSTLDGVSKSECDDVSEGSGPVSCESLECMKKIQELIKSEACMKKRITEFELKERAYMETLQQADELWSEMENSYKARIAGAEDSEATLREKVRRLEESESKFRLMYTNKDENYELMEKIQSMEQNEKQFSERIHVLETEKNKLVQETSDLRDTLVAVQTELENTKELVEGPLKDELNKEKKLSKSLQEEIKSMESEIQEMTNAHGIKVNTMKAQLNKTSRALVDMECTNSELKEEVETLETKVSELKSTLELQKANEEKLVIQMSQTILEKEKELEEAKREMQFSNTPSALEELKEAIPNDVVTKPISEIPKTECVKPCLQECVCPGAQTPLSVPALGQKPVLRRWLHQEEWKQW